MDNNQMINLLTMLLGIMISILFILLIVFVVGYVIISIQDWITDVRFYHRRTQRELNRIRASFCKVDCLPIGELESDKVYIFSESKAGTVTGTSLLCNEDLEELDAAEKLIKEAKEKQI